jgi:hypothetical protein
MPPDVDDVVSCGARDPGLRRNPHETFEVTAFQIAPLARNIELDVIVGGWAGEAFQVLTTKDHAQHPRRDMTLFEDGERPAARSVPDAAGSGFDGLLMLDLHISLIVVSMVTGALSGAGPDPRYISVMCGS